MTQISRPSGSNRQYWLVKTEPGDFSFDDLWNAPGRTTHWDGVRNFQARNFMRDEMKKGDLVFFYHSNCPEPGIVGVAEVVKPGYPDHTQFDRNNPHFDPKSDPKNPTWYMVDIRGVEKFPRVVPLSELRNNPELEGMPLLQKGNRLSVQKVNGTEWNAILKAAKEGGAGS
jgi:predicted RNA-binding protein with PUA-like domain